MAEASATFYRPFRRDPAADAAFPTACPGHNRLRGRRVMAPLTDILPPRYRDASLVGRGGMGEIYRATDEALGREVAVKVLSEAYAWDDDVRERFTREARAAARVSSDRNVVDVYDVGEWNDRPYIVMEYVDGGSVADRLKEGAPPLSESMRWLEQAAAALDAAHAQGVVHRDVKPANLLLARDGRLLVADFGVASAAGLASLTRTGTVLGTAGYLSPEQARGERATAASDRYGLGVVAWELLTGKRPFAAETATAEATAHATAPVPPISAAAPNLPAALDSVFRRALAKEPEERYPSSFEFVSALRTALDEGATTTDRFVAAPPTAATRRIEESPPRPVPAPIPAKRRRGLVTALVAAGLLGLGAVGIALAAGLDDGGGSPPDTVVKTVERTLPGTTVEHEVTVTAEPPPAPPPPPPPPAPQPEPQPQPEPPPSPPASGSPSTLNDQGYSLMRAGRYEEALPLLESAVQQLSGSGELTEAYASYNLAYTRFQLGNCDGVLELLDRSEAIQGDRKEITSLRKQAERRC